MIILIVDFINISVAAIIPLSLSGMVVGIFKVAEFNEHKKTATQWMEDANEKMDKHEENDAKRQQEVLERISAVEKNILEQWKIAARKNNKA